MKHAGPDARDVLADLAETSSLLGSAPFPVYCVASPPLGSPTVGDAHTVDGIVESIGIAYANPLVAGTGLQVITSPTEFARTLDELLDIETFEPDPPERLFPGDSPTRPDNGSCRVQFGGVHLQASLKRDGVWWGLQINAGETTVSVIANGPVYEDLVLAEINDLPALIRDRTRAIAQRVADARRNRPS